MFDRYLTSVEQKPATNLYDRKDKHEEFDQMVQMVVSMQVLCMYWEDKI